ncbi:MAG: Ig-like domain-containing protein, partial [Bifidobacteriaceae bacterium]|nr:Ig-like domain-containing protein [Bifidobacteriaceae bacterium]
GAGETPQTGGLQPLPGPGSVTIGGFGGKAAPTRVWTGKTVRYEATVVPAGVGGVTWTSSNPKVASVGPDGTVKGLTEGRVVITATAGAGISATRALTVMTKVAKVASPVKRATMTKGTALRIPAVAYTDAGTKARLTWKSSNPKVAKVATTGKVTALRPGWANITATSLSGKRVSMLIRVAPAARPADGLKAVAVEVGQTTWIKAAVTPAAATVTAAPEFTSSKPSVGTVDKAGRVTAKKSGTTVVTVRYAGKTARVTVRVP